MSDHTRLHHFGTTASDPDVRHFTEPSHVPVHLYRHHELSIKTQPKEWTTALVLKHLLVSWDLWTYRIGLKLSTSSSSSSHLRIVYHNHAMQCERQYDVMLVSMWLSCTYIRKQQQQQQQTNNNL